MGVGLVRFRTTGGTNGTAAVQARPDGMSIVGGGSAMQGGRPVGSSALPTAPAGGPNTALKMCFGTFTGSATYATGGETMDASVLGFEQIHAIIPLIPTATIPAVATMPEFDLTGGVTAILMKIRNGAAINTALGEFANGGNATSVAFFCLVIGT